MDILKIFLDTITANITMDINKSIKRKKESLKVLEMSALKGLNLIVFSICFLLGNFSSMIAVLLKDSLGYGIIFPLISSIFLYLIAIITLKEIYLFNKEKNFLIKKIDYDNNNTESK